MSSVPENMKYTKDHEWIRIEEELTGVCGITDHAQESLTDIVFVDLPEVNAELKQHDQAAVVESVKAVSNVYCPVSGRIVDVNSDLADKPELINRDPYGDGWIFKIEIKSKSELDELMDADSYRAYIEEGS